jgi:hypothetical protein
MHGDERAKICKEIAELVNQMTDAQAEEVARNIVFAQTYYELGRLSAQKDDNKASA